MSAVLSRGMCGAVGGFGEGGVLADAAQPPQPGQVRYGMIYHLFLRLRDKHSALLYNALLTQQHFAPNTRWRSTPLHQELIPHSHMIGWSAAKHFEG
jgi:hypothetical protein